MSEPRDALQHDGYAVLRSAVAADTLAAYRRERDDLRDGLLVRAPGDEHISLAANAGDEPAGAIDSYAISDAARAVLLPPALLALADDPPLLLFDAAESAAGAPDPGAHRDATYTALAGRPETLLVAAFATGAAT